MVALDAPQAEAQAVCPAGSSPNLVQWGAAGGIEWFETDQDDGDSRTYTNIGGSGIDMTMTMTDPSGMNEDLNNVLVNLPTGDGNWDGPFYTQTDGVYGNGFLTQVMTSLDDQQTVTFELDFSAPVLLPDFSIGDVDWSANRYFPNATPHDSFQDEILLSAERNGTPVGFTGTTGVPGSPVITLNDAANGLFQVRGGPYNDSGAVNGNLGAADAAGTVSLATLAPITSMSWGYSNGQDDLADDVARLAERPGGVWNAPEWAPPMTNTSVGVSNNHAVRINVFTVCTGDMTIGDRVWADVDGDGVQDPNEPGVPGVTVTLVGQDGLPLGTAVTGPDGEYEFDSLPPWDYSVQISDTPVDYTNTFDRDGTTVTPDNDSGTISLVGTDVLDADFGLQPPLGAISGTVFSDPGNDGIQDPGAGDSPIEGVTVTLTGTDLGGTPYNVVTTTDINGDYSFPNLPAGTYTVTESQPAGFDDGIDTPGTNATPAANDAFDIVLDIGESSIDNDFAELPDSSIAGTVFRDDDNDGEITGTDVGIGGATVTLAGTDNAGNAVSRTTTTNPDGTYLFDNLRDGTYTVTETQPAGFLDGMDDAGTVGGDDTAVNDQISGIVLPVSTDATEYDFGEVAESSIAGSVFDQDNAPIPGTTITLTGTDDLGAQVTATTTTDPNGDYSFAGLRPGTYIVTETQPIGFGDGDDFVGSEGGDDGTNDEFSAIVLPAGVDAVDYDFSETTSSIAGSVVDDAGNGIPNVVLNLTGLNASNEQITLQTTTDINGDYVFAMLQSGTYTVSEVQPIAYGDGDETAGSEGGDTATNDVIANIALPEGTASIDNDFAETRGSIAGSVFEDTNNNGVQDGLEVGIGGVTVELSGTDANGAPVTATTTTLPDGSYVFPGLLGGDYTITETQPASHVDGADTPGSAGGDVNANDVISAVPLPGGVDATDYDFGELLPASIAGTVFEDPNNNGVQDGLEDGIGGVTVELSGTDDLDNAVTATTTTAPDGTYSFTGLRPGTYVVTETQPAGYEDGIDTAGSEGGDDASVNDEISAIVVASGVDATDYDFGEIPPSSISGSVVDDFGNPISGVTLELTGTDDLDNQVTATTTTDANGDYVFPDLRPGTYTVTETQPPGYADGPETAGSTGGDTGTNDIIATIPLGPVEDSIDNDFEETTGSLAGSVFEDTNNNGVQDGVEPGIGGVTVELTGTDVRGGAVSTTVTTNPDGTYLFDNLVGGDYTVTETQPPTYFDGIDTPGSEAGDASVNDVISGVVLGDGVDATDYDFGELPPSSISGSVETDDGDPIPGVTLELSGTDDLGNPVTATTTTDPNGDYVFPDLRPGTYTVTETQPPGYGDGPETAGSTGGDIATDDVIASIPLGVDENSTDNDFEETTSSIAGSVFEDDNNDGQFDGGEAPIGGVTVELSGTDVSGNPVTATTTTEPDGSYIFDDLLEGTYTVTETQPASHIDGMDDAGSEGGDDSVDDVISAISLPAGTDAVEYDFGEIQLSSIAGSVFEDTNNNGVQDGLEDGIGGVTVELSGTDDLGNPVNASTTTNPDGTYSFPGLRPGTYTVTETQPPVFLDGIDTPGSEDGDATTNDVISAIELPPFTDATDYDFAEIPPASIAGSVVDDFGNPIPDVTIELSGTDDLGNPVTATTTTDPNGDYVFPDLRPGDYAVTETQPPGYGDGPETAGSTGGDTTTNDVITSIPLAPGDDSIDNDFEETTGSIAGTVFEDTNNNGVQDPGEDGIGNVTVELSGTDENGDPVAATLTTAPDGSYLFDNLLSGDYTVTETQPDFFLDGIDTAGSEGGDDTADDVISTIPLPEGVDATDYDFGEIPPSSISGSVVDDFGNPIPDVVIELSGTDDLGNPVSVTTTTDANGDYLFPGLRPGDYTVTETQPIGYGDGPETAGSTGGDTTTNDVISSIPLAPGENSLDNDFEETTSSISGTVFEDDNNNGIREPGEAGIADVTVELTGTDDQGNPVTVTTTTGPDGTYSFDELLSGDYTVTETQPTDYFDGADIAGSEGGDTSADDVISAIVLPVDTDATDYDFGEVTPSDISGTVEEDTTGDGVPEGPLEGVTVELVDENGDVVDSMTTDPNGDFLFEDVPPGEYIVREVDPTDYQSVSDVEGPNDNEIPLTMAGEDIVDRDFVDEPLADISGTVEEDTTGDGVPEGPLEGVTVELVDENGDVVASTTTDPNGDFLFEDVPPGEYIIREVDPTDYQSVSDVEGPNDNEIPVTMAGEEIVDQDFVDEPLADISGTVEEDTTGDGVPEGPLEGVIVELVDEAGDVVDKTTTDPNGDFLFEDVPPGEYIVREVDPTDYQSVSDIVDPNDNDIPVTVTGEDIVDQDFVDEPVADISGTVEEDTDQDGTPDEPLDGVIVELVDEAGDVVDTTTTDPNGDFLFEDVPPGEYIVRETDPAAYRSVSDIVDPNDNDIPVTMTGEDIVDQDFVDEPLPSSVSGNVLRDVDGDGEPDEPIEGATVDLVNENGVTVATTTTGPDGSYGFTEVPPGTYTLVETDPEDHGSVRDIAPPNDNTIEFTATNGDPVTDQDFLDEPLASITGVVEEDLDHDGQPDCAAVRPADGFSLSLQDPADCPLEGVVVELVDGTGTVVATTTTDPDGRYGFDDVPPGDYIVREVDPDGYTSISDVEGDNDNEIPITMTGVDVNDRDFMDAPVYDISGVVLSDTNGDGTGDDPIEGATVTLTNSDGEVLATTETDVDGAYVFPALPPGDYVVTEEDPSGFSSVSDNDGANDNVINVTLVDGSVDDLQHVDTVPRSTGLPNPAPLPSGFFAPPTPAPATSTDSGIPSVLALTGGNVLTPVFGALILIVLGSLFVAGSRRKSEAEEE